MTDGNADSGIEFDISSLLSVGDGTEDGESAGTIVQSTPQFHELKSRVVVGSARGADFRSSNMGSRTQLRQNLERQQVLDLEEREKQQAQARQSQQQSQTIAMPTIYHCPEVPPKVLQVKTRLQHPTEYHIKQKQQQAAKSFLNDSGDCQMPAHSMPNLAIPSTIDAQWISGSAPTEMEEVQVSALEGMTDLNLLDDFVLDPAIDCGQDSDLHSIEPSLTQMSSTMPQQPVFAQQYNTLEADSASAKSSSSCPPAFRGRTSPPINMSEEEQRLWAKDRQKKDNHNMIERRRRYNINDRIKELGELLPKNYDQEGRQNKGTILKWSVDYLKKLKKENANLRSEKEEKDQLEKQLQRHKLKLNQICAVLKQNGSPLADLADDIGGDVVPPNSVMNTQQHMPLQPVLKMEEPSPATHFNSIFMAPSLMTTQCDFMEDSSPVSSDPMLTSAPATPDHEDNSL